MKGAFKYLLVPGSIFESLIVRGGKNCATQKNDLKHVCVCYFFPFIMIYKWPCGVLFCPFVLLQPLFNASFSRLLYLCLRIIYSCEKNVKEIGGIRVAP